MEIRESDRVTRHKTDKLTKRKLSTGRKRPVQSKRDVFSGPNGRFPGLIPAISYGRMRFFLRQTKNRLFEKKMLMSSYRHGAIYMSAPQTHENFEKSGIGLYFFLYPERTRLPKTDDRMSYMLPDMLTRPPPACGAHAHRHALRRTFSSYGLQFVLSLTYENRVFTSPSVPGCK